MCDIIKSDLLLKTVDIIPPVVDNTAAPVPGFVSALIGGTRHDACLVNSSTGEAEPCQIELLNSIASGGQGEVWKAKILGSGKLVAVKNSEDQASLTEEAATSGLFTDDPNAVKLLGYANLPTSNAKGKLQGPVFELCEHGTLGDLITRHEESHHVPNLALDMPMICEFQLFILMVELMKALARIHAKNMAHCDIKPHNLMIEYDPVGSGPLEDVDFFSVKVTDFGLVLPMNYEHAVGGGTPAFMSPEHYLPKFDPNHVPSTHPAAVQPNMDTWAAGVTIVEAICGCEIARGIPAGQTWVEIHKRGGFWDEVVLPLLNQVSGLEPKWVKFLQMCFENSEYKRKSPRELARFLETHPDFEKERQMMEDRATRLENLKLDCSTDDESVISEDEITASPLKADLLNDALVPDVRPQEGWSAPLSPTTPEKPLCSLPAFTDVLTAATPSTIAATPFSCEPPAPVNSTGSNNALETPVSHTVAQATAPVSYAAQAEAILKTSEKMESAKGSPRKRSLTKRIKAWISQCSCFKKPAVVE